jgi:general stress protein YciG
MTKVHKSKPKGLAAMSPERRAEIASMGGKSVPADRRHYSDPERARTASVAGIKARRENAAKRREAKEAAKGAR